ncbi:MAG: 23S rRNA (adenine(1618)-N(6))-methyltransferase RlmF [Flavobacteriales bacterium]|nr:23S rRNA (adenine(1618)-N(6))-methyltransferase RlmF [Flavobacteriales bacterium]
MEKEEKQEVRSTIKTNLHPNNKNREQYDLSELIKIRPELEKHIKPNKYGEDSIQFSDPAAVKVLNKALLHHYYGIENWDFPDTNLCPPIPGRADYIHYMADLLGDKEDITCLDIGVGANCIYPVLGISEYNWNFIASDVDVDSIATAKEIVKSNPSLKGKVKFRIQKDLNNIFKTVIKPKDKIDVSICNPPFHSSKKEALKGSMRKVRRLTGKRSKKVQLNFSGAANELVFAGGEKQFIHNMIAESVKYKSKCMWFTTLVSNKKNLDGIYKQLQEVEATEVRTVNMGTANKISRIVIWSFLDEKEQKEWKKS